MINIRVLPMTCENLYIPFGYIAEAILVIEILYGDNVIVTGHMRLGLISRCDNYMY